MTQLQHLHAIKQDAEAANARGDFLESEALYEEYLDGYQSHKDWLAATTNPKFLD